MLKYYSDKSSIGRKLQKSSKSALNDVLGVVKVHSDYKINLIKDMRSALGGIEPGDRLSVVKVDEGCHIKKREMTS